ncbi:uncharacterized protein LOC106072836 [Biomphalaria glabrata]|uniref:Uncharacterized protein LOC106072836 n=1 Tax=Biomphalaria glabrata TaxID=6526 RepID=A0A9W2ZSW9_BIOGL|nr:uncharacterized protein LOC106072836 [Biomphalaria glabrata]XP_055878053.1 uncharacterized protein LOC106072836 [Biomphalaria glabrata]XP_055878054.1 uncharacterized protein LOC106072836 [Biomphalaria glabrata]XP_055878055.1 uncharacterized protein LOC106072836 [Biomphalaria glabrata]XP_055878056.1 uncharacterized protein LOC106072836 [Biomphalaria glabrata]XP_055878057.1 uncharacterized protein LOC106072836 [Biomphalaria glabrata]XP_055878058.1 uncharacterized protein LOC106072836 [Biomph
MIFIKKWQLFVKWLLFLITIFLLWHIVQHFLKIASGNSYNSYSQNDKVDLDHWSLNNADFEWLPNIMKSKSDVLPIVVVEEHYEVLKYWFQAAEIGLISKSRNILIHIDSHVDGAIPYDTEHIPWFRFPVNRKEVHNMMQRNDMFIVAATLTGLVDHVVWVWPGWDATNHESDWSHIIFDIQFGYLKVKGDPGIDIYKNDLCACWKVLNDSLKTRMDTSKKETWSCHRRNFTEIEAQDGPMISYNECMIQATAVFEVMSETKASTQLLKMYPAFVSAGVILDIDEDFFGCWSDMFAFQKLGTLQKSIDLLSELVADVLCAESVIDEQTADKFYTSLVNLVIVLKSQSCDLSTAHTNKLGKPCKKNIEINNFLIESIPMLIGFLSDQGEGHLLCHEEPKLQGLSLQSMVQLLFNFSIKELQILSDIGICFQVSPSSVYFENNGNLHVCHGENTPERSEVSFHYPSTTEIFSQNVTLRRILSSVFRKPDIITLCRSVRDGYTPKQLHTVIEKNILKTISNAYRSADIEKVHFDNNLLGGRTGWHQRKRDWVDKLLEYISIDYVDKHNI